MKRCPECRRDYYDDTLLYCLDDGTPLLDGPASHLSERPAVAGGLPQSSDFNDEPKTAILSAPLAGRRESPTAILQPPATTGGSDSSEKQSLSARRAAKPLGILSIAVVLLIGGFFGYRYFGSAGKQIESIAVMPFVNDSGNPEIEYLSDGMTEMLINSLSQVPNLKVKARSSVFRYKGKDIDTKKIAPELNVQAILNGHIIQRGDQLSLSLELIDAVTENVIWGNKYERKLSELVSLQSEVARDVAGKLKSKLSDASEQQVAKAYTVNTEAYQLYLKGIYHWNKRTGDELKLAISLFEQAIEKDPAYAKAYGGLAMAYQVFAANTASTKAENTETAIKARAAATKALQLDNQLAEAHAVLAERNIEDEWDFAGSEASYKRAIELNPNFASAHQWYSEVLSRLGRQDEALAEIKKAYEIDPFSRAVNQNLGLRLLEMRRYDEAQAQFEKLIQSEPDYPMSHSFLSGIYADRGEFERSLEPMCRAEVLLKIETVEACEKKAAEIRKIIKSSGSGGYWRFMLAHELKKYERGIGSPIAVAGIYVRLGEKEKAFEWLEKGFSERSIDITYLKVDNSFDSVRADPRFQALLKRVGLPPDMV